MKRFLAICLFFGFIAVSCGKDSSSESEVLTVSPDALEFNATASTDTVKLTSNCAWSAAVTYEGEQAGWLSLSMTRAQKSCTVDVKVAENESPSSRSAVVEFKTDGGLSSKLSVSQEGLATKLTIRVGSYNIRVSSADASDPDNNWTVRKSRLFQSIRDNDFDVFGLQELKSDQQTDLKNEFSSTYGIYIFSPYSQSGVGDNAQGIFYKKDKFTLVESHYYWTSATPDTQTLNDVNGTKSYSRGACLCILKHTQTGKKICFTNAHGHLNKDSNAAYAHVIVDKEKMYNTSDMPSFFVGDLNCKPDDAPSVTYRTHWSDTYAVLPASSRKGCEYTFNGFTYPEGKTGCRLDYIYYRGAGCTPKSYCCNNTLYGGLYASDHFPIYADFQLHE